MRTATCRCGLLIVADDEKLTVDHEAPVCDWFAAQVKKAAPEGGVTTSVTYRDEEGRLIKPGQA